MEKSHTCLKGMANVCNMYSWYPLAYILLTCNWIIFDVFRIPWTRISAPGPVSMNGSPADGSLLVRTSQWTERLTLGHWEMDIGMPWFSRWRIARLIFTFEVKDWNGCGLAELFKMSINLREHLRVTSLQLQIMIFSCLFFSTNLSKTKSQSILQI